MPVKKVSKKMTAKVEKAKAISPWGKRKRQFPDIEQTVSAAVKPNKS
jgi:hypothetical protein